MKKLIELLNEYRKQNPREFFGDDGSLVVLTWKDFIELNRLIIISKEYGFIKWLVDNDKIDLEKLDKKSERKPMYSFEEEWKIWFKLFEVYDSLLMLVAIQENPIEFLCSVLI